MHIEQILHATDESNQQNQDQEQPKLEDYESSIDSDRESGKQYIRRIEDVYIQPNDFIFENQDKD